MEDLIFTKEDYGRFCESKETLVQHWAYKQLIDSNFLFGLVEGKTEISFEMQSHVLKTLAQKGDKKNKIDFL